MQEIKQNFKLEQIQLLDLIDFFDRRANSRRHEPSPEYEIDSPSDRHADQHPFGGQTLVVPLSSTTVNDNDSCTRSN